MPQSVIGWHDHAGNDSCTVTLGANNWNETFSIPVRATIDSKADSDISEGELDFTLKLRAGFRTILTEKIPMAIQNKDFNKVMTCQSLNDPHIVTFDGKYYNNFYEGHFTLYKNTEYAYEVQVVYQKCNSETDASCNCAVSVRSGDDVFVVDKCRRTQSITCPGGNCEQPMKVILYKNGELTSGTRIFRREGGLRYEVMLPHGTFVKISASVDLLNVWIRPSAFDRDRTHGLCGVYNNNQNDDWTLPDGGVATSENEFSKAWRVPESEQIFHGALHDDSLGEYDNMAYCSCQHVLIMGVQCECGPDHLVASCDIDQEGEMTNATSLISQRSVRQYAADMEEDIEDDLDIDLDFEPPALSWKPDAAWDEAEATDFCKQAIHTDNAMAAKCEPLFWGIIQRPNPYIPHESMCKEDIQITDSDHWTPSAVEGAKEKCVDKLYVSVAYTDAQVAEYTNLGCFHECSGRGECNTTTGECECRSPYTGSDCSQEVGTTPYLVEPGTLLCDSRTLNCAYAKLFGVNLLPEYNLKCQVEKTEMLDANTITDSALLVNVEYISPYQVACVLPSNATYQVRLWAEDEAVRARMDGGTGVHMTYDAACYECDTETNKCMEKMDKDHCIIDGHCYAAGETEFNNTCNHCDPWQTMTGWALVDTDHCFADFEERLAEEEYEMRSWQLRIIIASVLSGTVALCAIILFCLIGRLQKETDDMEAEINAKILELEEKAPTDKRPENGYAKFGTYDDVPQTHVYDNYGAGEYKQNLSYLYGPTPDPSPPVSGPSSPTSSVHDYENAIIKVEGAKEATNPEQNNVRLSTNL